MYVTLPQQDLAPALVAIGAIAATGTMQQPILRTVLLEADAHGLTLSAANDETRIRFQVPATVQAPGIVLLPAHLLTGLLHDLPAAPLTVLSPAPTDPQAVQVHCQQVRANVKQSPLPLDEFPVPLGSTGCQELLTLDSDLFREVIEQVTFAAAADTAQPVLGGMRVALADGTARFAAADSFRLAVRTLAIPDRQRSAEVLIPARTLRHLARLLPPSGAVRLDLSPAGNQILFQTRAMECSTRLLEGRFPEYQSLTTIQPTTRVVLPTATFLDAVHLSARFARENRHLLRLHLQGERPGEVARLRLEADAPDLGASTIDLVEGVSIVGPDLSIPVNEHFLAEALAVIPSATCALECTQANQPLALKPIGVLDAASIMMPLALSSSTPAVPHAAPVAASATHR